MMVKKSILKIRDDQKGRWGSMAGASAQCDMAVTVSMLGGIEIECCGTVLASDSNRSLKLWGVLAYFILHRDRTISQGEQSGRAHV